MDRKIANNLMVGLVVLLGFAGFVFVLFNVGGGLLTSKNKLLGKFSNVRGLHMGSEVALSGLRIGVVTRVTIPPGNTKDLVAEMSIERSAWDRIRTDSIATIKTQGVLGDKYIEISLGSEEGKVVKPGDFIVTEEPADILAKGSNLVEEISKPFRKDGDAIALIKNLNEVSKNLVLLTHDLRQEKGLFNELTRGQSGEKVAQATRHIESILKKIDNGEGSLGALINDPTVYEDVKAITGGAKRSSILQYFMRQFRESGSKEETPVTPKK